MEVDAIFISSMVANRETDALVRVLPVAIATSLTVKLLMPVSLGSTSSVTRISRSAVKTVALHGNEVGAT